MITEQQMKMLRDVLLSHGGNPLLILKQFYDDKIAEQEKKTSTKGNLFEDIPQMYKREGAINLLKSLRSGLDDWEREAKNTEV